MNKILLVLMCLFVACSQPSGPAPIPSSVTSPGVPAPTGSSTEASDDPLARPPFTSKPFVPKIDPRSQDDVANAGCIGPGGKWMCGSRRAQPPVKMMASGNGTPGNCGPACTIPDWYLDFANGSGCASNANSGTSATCAGAGIGPLLNVSQLYARWGSQSPVLASATGVTTLHVLSSQPGTDTDPWGAFAPAAPNGMIAIIGTPVQVNASFLAGAVTQISRANPGNDFKVNVAAGASLGVGQLLLDSNAGSYCFIMSLASGVATCSSPLSSGPLTSPAQLPAYAENGSAWSIGDTLTSFVLPQIFIDAFTPNLGTLTTAGPGATAGASWLSSLTIGDPSGGASSILIRPAGAFNMTNMSLRPYMELDGNDASELYGFNVANCYFQNNFEGRAGAGGLTLYGGGLAVGAAHSTWVHDMVGFQLDFTAGANSIVFAGSLASLYNLHTAGLLVIYPGVTTVFRAGVANGSVWGAGTIHVYEAGTFANRIGGASAWTNNVLMAALQLSGAALTVGSAPPASGTITMNGASQVTNASGTFPAGASVFFSLNTAGGTPCLGAPYFSQATVANNFYIKDVTVSCNDVLNWSTGATPGVSLTSANLDTYGSLTDPVSGAKFTN